MSQEQAPEHAVLAAAAAAAGTTTCRSSNVFRDLLYPNRNRTSVT